MSLIHVMYASAAATDFHESQIPDLLKNARRANEKRGITGMLLYIGGSFFQLLEGETAAVDSIYIKIGCDPRHTGITQIIREPILERDFTGWTMGFSTIDPLEAGKLLGENDFFNEASCVTRLDSGRAKTLLIALGKRRWDLERSGMFRALGREAGRYDH
jgi:FAD-dependent sensor of blue light